MISERLRALKTKKKLTTAQIAEMSGISESTISRILSGQSENTTFATMLAIVQAMGGSLDEIAGLTKSADSDDNVILADRAQASVLRLMESEIIAMYKSMLANKDVWMRRMFVALCIFGTIFAAQWVIDALVPTVGWVRY